MVEIRDEYERTTTDEDAVETVRSMNRLIDMMQVAVMSVQAASASARAERRRASAEIRQST